MVYFCNYQNDVGIVSKLYRPSIIGFNKDDNEAIETSQVLLIISNWISTDDYYQLNQSRSCSLGGVSRPRRILYEDSENIIQLDYPSPFTNVDWEAINNSDIKFQAVGERINESTMKFYVLT